MSERSYHGATSRSPKERDAESCGRASANGAIHRRIDPSWWTH